MLKESIQSSEILLNTTSILIFLKQVFGLDEEWLRSCPAREEGNFKGTHKASSGQINHLRQD